MIRSTLLMLVMLWPAGCATMGTTAGAGVSDSGLCHGLEPLAVRHAAALVADGGDRSVVTGAQLLAGLDAGCGRTDG